MFGCWMHCRTIFQKYRHILMMRAELLAFTAFSERDLASDPVRHPQERLDKDIGPRTDTVGVSLIGIR